MSRASEAVLLKDHLKELRLPTMRRDYAECARQARETRASYEGFLLDLVIDNNSSSVVPINWSAGSRKRAFR